MSTPNRRYKGLLLDFGGVITTDFFASIDDHCQRLGLPRGRFRQVVTTNPAGRTPPGHTKSPRPGSSHGL